MNNKPILNLMIDLETASRKENAAILSWAMVPFSLDGRPTKETVFHKTVSLTSCFLAGMDIEKETQEWWMKQDPVAKFRLCSMSGEDIVSVAYDAYTWMESLSGTYDLYIWSRGLDFDIPKIEWCFNRFVERPLPYKYSHKMDVRTVLRFAGVDQSQFEFKGVKHCAADDCMHDIRMVQEAYIARMNLLELLNGKLHDDCTRIVDETLGSISKEDVGKAMESIAGNRPIKEKDECRAHRRRQQDS